MVALIALVCAVFFGAEPFDTFLWSGTIGTLILLVAYVLATIGCIKLLFVDRKMKVPMWEVVIPLAALVMLGYTIWRNVIPYPDANPAQWFPVRTHSDGVARGDRHVRLAWTRPEALRVAREGRRERVSTPRRRSLPPLRSSSSRRRKDPA